MTPKTGFCNSSRDKGLQPKSRNFSDPRSKFSDPNPAADQGETEKPTTTTTTTTTRTTTTTTITTEQKNRANWPTEHPIFNYLLKTTTATT